MARTPLGIEIVSAPQGPDQRLVVYATPPGSSTARLLPILASWDSDGVPTGATVRPGRLPGTSGPPSRVPIREQGARSGVPRRRHPCFTRWMRWRRKISLADVYARIPEVRCKGLCEESCGPIAMSVEEDRRLQARGMTIPSMLDGVAAIERGEDYWCPALREGRCTVYDDRPTICRLWGATRSMPCPHGCTPEGALSQEESHELLGLAAAAGGGMAPRLLSPSEPPETGAPH